MRITVLGKSPSWPDVDGACSGYLVQHEDLTILVDCGNGVFAKMRRFVDYVDIDAVVISHMHADHMLDLVPFAYALTYAPRQQPVPVPPWPGTEHPARPKLFVPQGGLATLRHIVGSWGDELLVEKAFRAEEYAPDGAFDLGGLQIAFRAVPHFVPTWAIRVVSPQGKIFTYGADHNPDADFTGFAERSDLLFLEATLPRPEREGPRGHLTPGEAGEYAERLEAGRLVLVHISDELDFNWAKAEAQRTFSGPVEVAAEGAVYDL